ncbi:spermatogenesis-associated protein 9 [Tiliqua scincoides]|uniref:spermatogenesis-associated protein 9 n=1 Tax=Tiliqua scincoides TaxID=71010 RepID=UPI0034625363
MALRPIGWICGELVRKLAGQAEIIQRVFLEIIDEIRDEFPNILRLTSSNQQSDQTMQGSRSVMARVLSSSHRAVIMNGLTKLSSSSKSVAKLLQPQLARKLAELNKISHRLLTKVNTPKQPLYKMKDKRIFFYDIISYPAQTALTSVMCASYAALIYLAVSLNKVVEKIKKILEGEQASRENSSDAVDEDEFLRASETASDYAASSTQEVASELTIKEPQTSGSIHTLLPAVDQENEQ